MREYTAILTIKVIASVMAESEDEAQERAWGNRRINDHRDDAAEARNGPPPLLHPQVIGLTACTPVSRSSDQFKGRTFNKAACEVHPDLLPEFANSGPSCSRRAIP